MKTVVGAVETEMLYHGWHMIGAFEKKVSGDEWLWQEVPMSRGEGMIEHVALDANTAEYLGYAVHEDWQNTVWALSNTSAVVVERYEQDDPFGKSHTLDASGNNLGNFASQVHHHKRMHGGVVEEVTGLYDFRNRWYLPQSGAWLSRDPLGYVDSENLYQGVHGNLLSSRDVFGDCKREVNDTAYGSMTTLECDTPGESDSFPTTCKGKAGCTSASCKVNGGKVDCTIHVRIDCKHPDAKKNGCANVRIHEQRHVDGYKECFENSATGFPAVQRQAEAEGWTGDKLKDRITEVFDWCAELQVDHVLNYNNRSSGDEDNEATF